MALSAVKMAVRYKGAVIPVGCILTGYASDNSLFLKRMQVVVNRSPRNARQTKLRQLEYLFGSIMTLLRTDDVENGGSLLSHKTTPFSA
jgi:hypothetical protein